MLVLMLILHVNKYIYGIIFLSLLVLHVKILVYMDILMLLLMLILHVSILLCQYIHVNF